MSRASHTKRGNVVGQIWDDRLIRFRTSILSHDVVAAFARGRVRTHQLMVYSSVDCCSQSRDYEHL
jgi:hypothetical protein